MAEKTQKNECNIRVISTQYKNHTQTALFQTNPTVHLGPVKPVRYPLSGGNPTVLSDSMSVTMGDPNGQSQSNFVQKKFNNGSFWAVLAGTSFL